MSELGQKLIAIVRRKAAENPDYVYKHIACAGIVGCAYVHNGEPSCLIGQALFEAGVIDASFEYSKGNQDAISYLAERLQLPIDIEELQWLTQVQDGQDVHQPWGRAVEIAENDPRGWPW